MNWRLSAQIPAPEAPTAIGRLKTSGACPKKIPATADASAEVCISPIMARRFYGQRTDEFILSVQSYLAAGSETFGKFFWLCLMSDQWSPTMHAEFHSMFRHLLTGRARYCSRHLAGGGIIPGYDVVILRAIYPFIYGSCALDREWMRG